MTVNKNASSNAIVTVVGNDSVGIIAKVSGFLAERKVNIEDVNQSILSGCFVMMMMVDLSGSASDLETLKAELTALGGSMNVSISIWHEDVFAAMHRI
ncbi:MAG: ACT domain-containing protein [Spirochaetaceae bacterium]|jgi:ACT domain-containing protein|nr:ACT domain-containing protein [Spirochaetaceae bacterium]